MTANLVDFIAEKLFSFTSKMKDDSFQQYSSSNFLDSVNTSHHWDPLKAVSVMKQNNILNFEDCNVHHPNIFLNQLSGVLDSTTHNFNFLPHLENYLLSTNHLNSEHASHSKNGLSPHLLNLISSLNTYHYKRIHSDMSLISASGVFFGKMIDTLFNNKSPEAKQNLMVNSGANKMPCNLLKSESTVTSNNMHSLGKKPDPSCEKCDYSAANVKLNLKMANRKTKQINKRSKNRRRRQKRSQVSIAVGCNISSDDESEEESEISGSVSADSRNSDFECIISFQHSPTQIPSCLSSWGSTTYQRKGQNFSAPDVTISFSSSPTQSECKALDEKLTSSIISFVVPVGDSNDEDSDWTSGDSQSESDDNCTDTSEFEFSGLFITNLCSAQTSEPSSLNVHSSQPAFASDDETDESLQLKKALLEVNKNWNKLTEGDDSKLKSASKVTFAAEEQLVEVFPVEMCERKGEWEMYATERLRFKRKIDELEKVLSPCLRPEHRSEVLKKLMESGL